MTSKRYDELKKIIERATTVEELREAMLELLMSLPVEED